MSRVAKSPVNLPSGVEIKIDGQKVALKGSKGSLEHDVHELVAVSVEDGVVSVKPHEESQKAWALAGTTRALLNNMVTGVAEGFELSSSFSVLVTVLRLRVRYLT